MKSSVSTVKNKTLMGYNIFIGEKSQGSGIT